MPKIIDNLKNRILDTTQREISEKGYSGITIRTIAESCGIALGTFYNYFKSKERLVASLILRDWIEEKRCMESVIAQCTHIHSGMGKIAEGLRTFYRNHKGMWKDYRFTGESEYAYDERHQRLINQLCAMISNLLEKLNYENDAPTCRILAEMVIVSATGDIDYEQYGFVIERVIIKRSLFKEDKK